MELLCNKPRERVVDGIGASVKRAVSCYIRSEKELVTNAFQFYHVAAQINPNVHVKFIGNEEINANKEVLENYWENVMAVPNALKIHHVRTTGLNKLLIKETSTDEQSTSFIIFKLPNQENDDNNEAEIIEGLTSDLTLKIGDWVIVQYDGTSFPGEVKIIENNEVAINVMHRSDVGYYWKWPNKPDQISNKKLTPLGQLDPEVNLYLISAF